MSTLKHLGALTLTCLLAGNLASPVMAHGRHGHHHHEEPRSRSVEGFIFGLGIGYGLGVYTPHHHHHHTRYPNDRRCSWGSGYRGCYHRKEALEPVELEIRTQPPKEDPKGLEAVLNRTWGFCNSFYGCGGGVRITEW